MPEHSTNPPAEPPHVLTSRMDRARGGMARFFFAESLVVVLSVLAALGLDRWSAERERRALAEAAMTEVVEEVRLNLAELEWTDSITRFRLDSLERMSSAVDNSRPLISYAPPGFYTADLNRAAWERLSRSAMELRVPADFSNQGFHFYRGVTMLQALETRVQDIYFGPLQYRAADASVSLEVSRALMRQQLSWIAFYREVATELLSSWNEETIRRSLGV